ncbi:hypothetical protein [Cellvibrio sp. KY-GH-1]|uniref:hypothetical protein n=1 Tax=Cellvibrio sp. KY-GH-1 TaxID=2303332 RepID=UPI001246B8C8|nr:hypothetical protein [Cellvibrio sp. KY-GH-1]
MQIAHKIETKRTTRPMFIAISFLEKNNTKNTMPEIDKIVRAIFSAGCSLSISGVLHSGQYEYLCMFFVPEIAFERINLNLRLFLQAGHS